MSQSEEKSAYELERQDNMRQNREKLLALGILDSPAPTSRTGKKRPRPPAGEKTREQPKRGAGGEGARPSYRESPPPASARHPAASPANGAAAPAMDASAGAASEAAQAEAASAADELCANRSRFVLRRNPSATVATVYVAGHRSTEFSMAWLPHGRGVRLFVEGAAADHVGAGSSAAYRSEIVSEHNVVRGQVRGQRTPGGGGTRVGRAGEWNQTHAEMSTLTVSLERLACSASVLSASHCLAAT